MDVLESRLRTDIRDFWICIFFNMNEQKREKLKKGTTFSCENVADMIAFEICSTNMGNLKVLQKLNVYTQQIYTFLL